MSDTPETAYMHTPEQLTATPLFGIEPISRVISELNTEAKCITTLFTPQVRATTRDISESLSEAGAYDFIDNQSFKVSVILGLLPEEMVRTYKTTDEVRKSMMVNVFQKNPGYFGDFIDGISGDLLDHSITYDRPLRELLGEKQHNGQGCASNTELTIATIAAILDLSRSSQNGSFLTTDLIERIRELYEDDTISVPERTIKDILQRLQMSGCEKTQPVLKKEEKIPNRNNRTTSRLWINDEDTYTNPTEELLNIVGIVGRYASIMDYSVVEAGRQNGDRITGSRDLVSKLVLKSYMSTNHTGKQRGVRRK